ncbi:MAG: serine/threonine protein kinase [Candidatus Obscuribacterales bacterium]|nr:serine/threonine protein kinase [Candidatus Obscuribacterales bacterium]
MTEEPKSTNSIKPAGSADFGTGTSSDNNDESAPDDANSLTASADRLPDTELVTQSEESHSEPISDQPVQSQYSAPQEISAESLQVEALPGAFTEEQRQNAGPSSEDSAASSSEQPTPASVSTRTAQGVDEEAIDSFIKSLKQPNTAREADVNDLPPEISVSVSLRGVSVDVPNADEIHTFDNEPVTRGTEGFAQTDHGLQLGFGTQGATSDPTKNIGDSDKPIKLPDISVSVSLRGVQVDVPDSPPPGSNSGLTRAKASVKSTINRMLAIVRPEELLRVGPIAQEVERLDSDSILANTYSIVGTIGEGPSSLVYLGKHVSTRQTVAIKTVKFPSMAQAFSQDAKAQENLNNPNIVWYLGYLESEDNTPYLITEYSEAVSLSKLLHEQTSLIGSEDELISFVYQLVDALIHAHSSGVFHCNLKPSNILLIENDDKVFIKLLDFGYRKPQTEFIQFKNENRQGELELDYQSPEILNGSPPTKKSDVYSAGVLIYRLVAGKMPDRDGNLALETDYGDNNTESFLYQLKASKTLIEVLQKAIEKDPEKRHESLYSFKKAMADWFDKAEAERLEHKQSRTREIVKSDLYNLVSLRRQQLEREQTVMMKFASAAAKTGPRLSPAQTAMRIATVGVGTLVVVVAVVAYLVTNVEIVRTNYLRTAKILSSPFKHKRSKTIETTGKNPGKQTNHPTAVVSSNQSPKSSTVTSMPVEQPKPIQAQVPVFRYEDNPVYSKWIVREKFSEPRRIEPH